MMPERVGFGPRPVEPVMPIATSRRVGKEEQQPPKPDVTSHDTLDEESPPKELSDDSEHIISTRR